MDLLSISPSHPLTSTRNLSPNSKPHIFSFNPKTSIPYSRCRTPVRCVFTGSPRPSKNSNFGAEPRKPRITLELSAPHAPATRGAESDVMGLLLRERIVFLGTNIDDFVADAIMSQLLLLDAKDPTKDIRLFINSSGGSLSATMAIFDAVQLVRADVSTVALGISASTASIILGGGTKGKRFAMPNARIMIHQPLGSTGGEALDVEIQAKEIMHNKTNVIRIISGFSGRSPEQVEKDIDRDKYMSPIEGVEYGIIDGVIDRDRIIPLVPLPDKVDATLNFGDITDNFDEFMNPHIPDDEVY